VLAFAFDTMTFFQVQNLIRGFEGRIETPEKIIEAGERSDTPSRIDGTPRRRNGAGHTPRIGLTPRMRHTPRIHNLLSKLRYVVILYCVCFRDREQAARKRLRKREKR